MKYACNCTVTVKMQLNFALKTPVFNLGYNLIEFQRGGNLCCWETYRQCIQVIRCIGRPRGHNCVKPIVEQHTWV